jgi:TonB family protein
VQRSGGAIAWKLLLGIAAGVGAIWVAAQSTNAPSEPVSRAVGGPIAKPTTVAGPDAHSAPARPVAQASPPSDPFAGVDVSNNSVLRHIARIEEKPRGRAGAPTRVTPAAPARSAAAAAIDEPVRQVAAAQGLAREEPLATVLPIAAAPSSEPNRAVVTTQTAAFSEQQAQNAPAPERPAAAPESANAAKGSDRVLVAALGNTVAPPPPVNAPLRVTHRTVPSFPIEAIRAGIQSGRVVARLTIEADGRVSATQIVSAMPIGYFERESRRALATWRYEPPGRAASADVELVFNRE